MATTYPSGGIAQQGISAAIVYQAITKISDMLVEADQAMAAQLGPNINKPLNDISNQPEMMKSQYVDSLTAAQTALQGVDLEGENPKVPTLPAILDQTIGSFFADYTTELNRLFPGLGAAGADADAFVQNALASSMGVSYIEFVDYQPAAAAFLLARKDAFAQERTVLDTTAAAGHRFAPGVVLEGLARMNADSIKPSTDQLAATFAARAAEERSQKMRLVAASLGTHLQRIRMLHQQAAEAFKQKMRARGLWVGDQDAVLDADAQRYTMSAQFDARLTELLRTTAARRHGTVVKGYQAYDKDMEMGRMKVANGQEVVDLFGNMVTTLLNQVRANGSYQGSERDRTDWEGILAP